MPQLKKVRSAVAMAAMLVSASAVWATSPQGPTVSLDDTATAPAAAPAPTPPPPPPPLLSYGLEQIPTGNGSNLYQDMNNLNIVVSGYAEVGYTANFDHVAGTNNFGRIFDAENGNHIQLDQVDVSIAKAINFSDAGFRKRGWDIGGRVEVVYGMDPDNFHSNGLDFYHGNAYYASGQNPYKPINQFDIFQAYVTLAMPIGDTGGLKVRIGKFATLLGEEYTTNVTANLFYSHSYEFNYAIPLTHTGILADYQMNADWNFWAGFVRGWNQTFKKTNNALGSFLGEIAWTPQEAALTGFSADVATVIGPEDPVYPSTAYGDNKHYRSVVELLASYNLPKMPALTLYSATDWGYDGAGYTDSIGTHSSQWFGEAVYASYVINSYVTLNGRAEYYFDGHSTTVGGDPGTDVNYAEFTVGTTITPFPNSTWGKYLKLRPELREDMADKAVFQGGAAAGVSSGVGKKYQTTAAMDVIYSF